MATIGFRGLFHNYRSQWNNLIQEDETENENYLQVVAKNRKRTDRIALYLQAGLSLLLFCFVIYCWIEGDVDRIFGYDKCGNVCGKMNDFPIMYHSECEAQDMRSKPFLLIDDQFDHHCVEDCSSDYTKLFDKICVPTHGHMFHDVASLQRDFSASFPIIMVTSCIALGLSLLIVWLFKVAPAFTIWSILCSVIIILSVFSTFLWYREPDTAPVAIVLHVITLILIVIMIAMKKRIELVIKLFAEAGKVASSIPLILFEPILTFGAVAISITIWIYIDAIVITSGFAVETNGRVVFVPNGATKFTYWLNNFMQVWFLQFICGCQSMIIAGAASTWFFTRDKTQLSYPLLKSFHTTIRYHLGTISLGSLIIALLYVIRKMVHRIKRIFKCITCICCHCCCSDDFGATFATVEKFLKYITRNAYIVTAIHGHEFMEAGTKAFTLITENIFSVVAINCVGDFVLGMGKVIVVTISLGITMIIGLTSHNFSDLTNGPLVPLLVVGIISFLMSHCFMTVYEMIIETIFICFCEDCKMNDGITRPYYMNVSLMEFIENSERQIGKKSEEERPKLIVVQQQSVPSAVSFQ